MACVSNVSQSKNDTAELVDFLNETLPTIEHLRRHGPGLLESTKNQLASLKSQLYDVSSENSVAAVSIEWRNLVTQIETANSLYEELVSKVCQDHMPHVMPLLERLEDVRKGQVAAENQQKHLLCLEQLEELDSSIEAALVIDEFNLAVKSFHELSEFAEELSNSKSDQHAAALAVDRVHIWHSKLTQSVKLEFVNVLHQLGWPFTSSAPCTIGSEEVSKLGSNVSSDNGPLSSDGKITLARFQLLFTQMSQLTLPKSMCTPTVAPVFTELAELLNSTGWQWRPFLAPIDLMLDDFRKKFAFHFYGNRRTAEPSKPEYYMTQVLQWARDHQAFMIGPVQDCLRSLSGSASVCDARLELLRGLVELVLEKMASHLPEVVNDDASLAHFILEALQLDSDLADSLDYPVWLPGPAALLCLEPWFTRWMQLERKLVLERLDELLDSPSAWRQRLQTLQSLSSNTDYSSTSDHVPECADLFLVLLQQLSGRSRLLRNRASCRLQILDIQLDLLENFRIRLLQVSKEAGVPGPGVWSAVLNALHFVLQTLLEWTQEDLYYAELNEAVNELREKKAQEQEGTNNYSGLMHAAVSGKDMLTRVFTTSSFQFGSSGEVGPHAGEGTVFERSCALFQHMIREQCASLVQQAYTNVVSLSRAWRSERWLMVAASGPTYLPSNASASASAVSGLSPSAVPVLSTLRCELHEAYEALASELFEQFWRPLAARLSDYLLNKLILANNFSEWGGFQVAHDINKGLIPLFALYTRRPEVVFKELKEACSLLTLSSGSALLLIDICRNFSEVSASKIGHNRQQVQDPLAALRDVDITSLDSEKALQVLLRRVIKTD